MCPLGAKLFYGEGQTDRHDEPIILHMRLWYFIYMYWQQADGYQRHTYSCHVCYTSSGLHRRQFNSQKEAYCEFLKNALAGQSQNASTRTHYCHFDCRVCGLGEVSNQQFYQTRTLKQSGQCLHTRHCICKW